MGIRGLTTFIQNRSHLYMEKYELHDTNLVMDGNSIACQLYRWHCKSNDCFGGDYDSFGQLIYKFFRFLFECKITPYIVFDGGYENRKIATVISRMKNKISSALALNTVTEGSVSVFPLFLRDVFYEIVKKLNIKSVRCDFESDTETASIARSLNCPVLSYDSDYFIFDVMYIPFASLEMKVRKHKDSKTKTYYKYISCEVYRVEKFLNSFSGLDKRNLPLLAVLLGNDYVKRRVFALFFQNLKKQRVQKGQSEQQTRIKSVLIWLQNETIESAIRKVLGRYRQYNRHKLLKRIESAMNGYFKVNSEYLKYIGIIPSEDINRSDILDFSQFLNENNDNKQLEEQAGEEEEDLEKDNENSESDNSSNSNKDTDSEDVAYLNINSEELNKPNLHKTFLDNFRRCVYPPCFMDIVQRGQYYSIPQVEHLDSEHAHSVSLEILSAIHKILTNSSSKNLVCICRVGRQVHRENVPLCSVEVPLYLNIFNMNLKDRQSTFLDILKLNKHFRDDCLALFPKSWHLFIISIKYSVDKTFLSWPLIISFLLGKIILEHIDKKIDYCRDRKKCDNLMKTIKGDDSNHRDITHSNCHSTNILDALTNISFIDSYKAIDCFLSYFQMSEKMKSCHKSFDRTLVHRISQFQSILLHVRYLNLLLHFPFEDIVISESLNCTFVYNFASNLKKRTNSKSYVELMLRNCPTILDSFSLIESTLQQFVEESNIIPDNVPKKRRRKKKSKEEIATDSLLEVNSQEDDLFDPNNKFSLLSIN